MNDKSNPQFSEKMLLQLARDSRANAYAPYSGYTVGAACIGETGVAYFGCNVENASYPAGICAERSAVSSAIAHEVKKINVVAIAAGKKDCQPDPNAVPCGFCLQFLSEFMDSDGVVLVAGGVDGHTEYRMSDLLPLVFNLDESNGECRDE